MRPPTVRNPIARLGRCSRATNTQAPPAAPWQSAAGEGLLAYDRCIIGGSYLPTAVNTIYASQPIRSARPARSLRSSAHTSASAQLLAVQRSAAQRSAPQRYARRRDVFEELGVLVGRDVPRVLRPAHCALRCASSRAHPCWQGRAPGHTGPHWGGCGRAALRRSASAQPVRPTEGRTRALRRCSGPAGESKVRIRIRARKKKDENRE